MKGIWNGFKWFGLFSDTTTRQDINEKEDEESGSGKIAPFKKMLTLERYVLFWSLCI